MLEKKKSYGILVTSLFNIIGIGLVLSFRTITIAEQQPSENEVGTPGFPNPASVYCEKLGFKLEDGNCIFSDGSKCNAWDFFRGKCGQRFTYC
jgi:putative hemolysin